MAIRADLIVVSLSVIVVTRGKLDVYRTQQGENSRLQNADQQLKEVEWKGQQNLTQKIQPLRRTQSPQQSAHRMQQRLTRKNITEQSQRKRYRTESNGNQLNQTHKKENRHQGILHQSSQSTLRPKRVKHKSPDS